MATPEENLQTLQDTKDTFKSKFASADVSTTNVEFKNYPNLLDQMEKILPSQVKNVVPTTSLQSVSADSGKKLIQVNISGVTNAIDSNIQAGNIKKNVTILGVTGTFEGGVTPTGTINITENGTYNVTNYASANVNVSGGGSGDLYTTNRQLVAMKDLQNSTFGGGSYDESVYTDTQLDYIQDLFDYILRGA